MNEKVVFIGGGNMARNIVLGLIESGVNPQQLCVADPNAEKRAYFEARNVRVADDNSLAIQGADVVMLCVKPKDIKPLCQSLQAQLVAQKPLILSVAVGVPTNLIETWLGGDYPVVRAMPNTPSSVNAGATGLFANAIASKTQKNSAEGIMRAVGLAVWVEEESLIEVVAAVSGSGPAYFFLIMEAIEKAGQALGLPAETAQLLTKQTALGAARMSLESEEDVVQLRRFVTSPGGTTEQAIAVLEKGNIQALFQEALRAAVQRAKELSQMVDQ